MSSTTPTISVIVPVYNRFELTKRAVESVLSQTMPVSEVLLMDDGSFDGTSELLQRYVEGSSSWRERVRYLHQENQGPGAARNKGINEARCEWLAFLDNDDLWLPQKLEWQFRALDQFNEQCSACITDAWFMNNPRMKMTLFELAGKQHKQTIGMIPDPIKYIVKTKSIVGVHPVWMQNLVIRTELARRIGGFDPTLRCGEDDDFAFRLGCETKLCFVNMPMVLIDRTPPDERHVSVNKRWDDTDYRLEMAQQRYEKRLQISDRLPDEIRTFILKDLAAVHSGWTNWFLKRKEYNKARRASTEAAKVYLTPSLAIKWVLTRSVPGLIRKIVLYRDRRYIRKTEGLS
jgi:glycosyltransferase involved in cell wall biosynthesis